MSYYQRFPYEQLQHLQQDVDSLKTLVSGLNSTLQQLLTTLNTPHEHPLDLNPIFTTCTAGELIYLDDNGEEVNVEDELDTKLTSTDLTSYATQTWVEGKNYLSSIPSTYLQQSQSMTPVKGVVGRSIELGAESPDSSYIDFHSKDGSTQDFDARIICYGGSLTSPNSGAMIVAAGSVNMYTNSLMINDVPVATQTWVDSKNYLTALPANATFTTLKIGVNNVATESWVTSKNYLTSTSLTGYATQTWVEAKNYLTTLPATANFTTLKILTKDVATQEWVEAKNYLTTLPATANFTTLKISNNDVATQLWVTNRNYLTTLPTTANFTTLQVDNETVATRQWVLDKGYLTSLPADASFTTLKIGTTNVATELWVNNKNYLTATALVSYATQTWVEGKNYLTTLPSTANFTTLKISTKDVATQEWVLGKNYLTALPTTANFTTLTLDSSTVATQSYVDGKIQVIETQNTESFNHIYDSLSDAEKQLYASESTSYAGILKDIITEWQIYKLKTRMGLVELKNVAQDTDINNSLKYDRIKELVDRVRVMDGTDHLATEDTVAAYVETYTKNNYPRFTDIVASARQSVIDETDKLETVNRANDIYTKYLQIHPNEVADVKSGSRLIATRVNSTNKTFIEHDSIFSGFMTQVMNGSDFLETQKHVESIYLPIETAKNNYYKKVDADDKFAPKSDTYTKTETDDKYPLKTDTYTKTECDNKFPLKTDTYTKTAADNKFLDKTTAGTTYATITAMNAVDTKVNLTAGQVLILQNELIRLGVMTTANGIWNFANSAATIVTGSVLDSKLNDYAQLNESVNFSALTVNSKTVATQEWVTSMSFLTELNNATPLINNNWFTQPKTQVDKLSFGRDNSVTGCTDIMAYGGTSAPGFCFWGVNSTTAPQVLCSITPTGLTTVGNISATTFNNVAASQLSYLTGVNSNIQTQLSGKFGLSGVQTLTGDITSDTDTYNFFGTKPSKFAHLANVNSDINTQLSGKFGLSGVQTLTGDITSDTDTYNFFGTKPSKFAHLANVNSDIQTQLNTKLSSIPNTYLQQGVNITPVLGVVGRSIELGADAPNITYIDFHSKDGSTQDYDARIICEGGNLQTPGLGALNIIAGALMYNSSTIATQSYVLGQNYLRFLPTSANFTTLTVNNTTVATESWVTNKNYLTTAILTGYATQTWVEAKNYLTSLPTTANFTTLTISNAAVATQSYVTGFVLSQNYISSLPTSANFLSLTINGQLVATQTWVEAKNYLTTLPATANFTTLKISNNDVATQLWVTNRNYLTALPTTANFTTLQVDNETVATRQWVLDKGYLTALPATANFTTLTLNNSSVATQDWVNSMSFLTELNNTTPLINTNWFTTTKTQLDRLSFGRDNSVTGCTDIMAYGGTSAPGFCFWGVNSTIAPQVLCSITPTGLTCVGNISATTFNNVAASQLSYLTGVTSNIQTQLNSKLSSIPTTYLQIANKIVPAYGIVGRSVELGADSANTSYVDFHSKDGSLQDYDGRIICSGGNLPSSGGGSINIISSSLTYNSANIATQNWVQSQNYLTTLPTTANFNTLTVNNANVLTALPSTATFTSINGILNTTLAYLGNVTSDIQAQLDSKVNIPPIGFGNTPSEHKGPLRVTNLSGYNFTALSIGYNTAATLATYTATNTSHLHPKYTSVISITLPVAGVYLVMGKFRWTTTAQVYSAISTLSTTTTLETSDPNAYIDYESFPVTSNNSRTFTVTGSTVVNLLFSFTSQTITSLSVTNIRLECVRIA